MESLSPAKARKLVLQSQRLPAAKRQSKSATLEHLQHLGYIQIDTISVVQRAHHHCLWSRNPSYQLGDIENLVAKGHAFEYWSHAAAYLPMRDYRYSLPRKAAITAGEMDHWYPREEKQMREVLARIHAEGPLKARDFEQDNRHKKPGEWHHKPAKRALTYLFMQGELMCARREGFQMVYDLRERVLPAGVDCSEPSADEFARHLLTRYLSAHGIGQLKDVAYLRKGLKAQLEVTAMQMLEEGDVIKLDVVGMQYLALASQLALLDKRQQKSQACILSPFDNLLIQRHRMRDLFNFNYQIECYVTAKKRQHGYFCLPVLWQGQLVARIDCKAERKSRTLVVLSVHLEESLNKVDEFKQALRESLSEFAQFNDCDEIKMGKL